MKYIAVGNNSWGSGKTATEAVKNCREAGGKPRFLFKTEDDGAYVDSTWGTVCAIPNTTDEVSLRETLAAEREQRTKH